MALSQPSALRIEEMRVHPLDIPLPDPDYLRSLPVG
jgi:hypothetical protein